MSLDADSLTGLDARVAAERASTLMRGGLVCSEAVLIAVGEQVRTDFDPAMVRLATGFGGGIGRSRDEVCGAFSGGVMVLGLLHGRQTPTEDGKRCLALAKAWREAFIDRFGTSRCRPIYDSVRQPGGPGTCADVAGETAALLVTLLTGGRA